MTDFAYVFSGFLVGGLVGVTGVGGGSLMSPILILLFGVTPMTAIGTDLCFAAATKLFGSLFHHRYGSLNFRIAALLAAGSIPTSLIVISALYYNSILFDPAVTTTLLGAVLLFSSIATMFRGRIGKILLRSEHSLARFSVLREPATVMCGCIVGAMVILTSVGAGALGAVFLLILYPRLPARQIAGTDIAHAVPLTIVGGAGYLLLGSVDLRLLGLLLLGSLPGVLLGTFASARLDDRLVRHLITLVLFIAGIKLLLR